MTAEVMSATVTGSEPLEIAPPVRLFHGCGGTPALPPATIGQAWFDVAADGDRFLLACAAGGAPSPVVVSVNWTASLK
jgi:transposase